MDTENAILQNGIEKYLTSEHRSFPQHTHRSSSVGHPCSRYLYYSIRDWDKASMPSTSMKGIYMTGQALEDILVSIFNKHIGPSCSPQMRIIAQQTPVRDKLMETYRIGGTFDGILQIYDPEKNTWENLGVVDIKTCSPNLFNSYADIKSLYRHTWSSLYATQVMMYSFSNNMPTAYLMFVNKGNIFKDWKIIKVPVDFAHVENVLQKCETINKALSDANAPPPSKLNKPAWCSDCRFEAICMPEVEYDGTGPKLNEDDKIESVVERMIAIKPLVKEYETLDKTLKNSLIKGQDLILKKSMIRWKQINGTRQPQTGGAFSYWTMKLTPTQDTGEDDDE